MPEARQQIENTITSPAGPLRLVIGGTAVGIIQVTAGPPAVVTITPFTGAVQTSTTATFDTTTGDVTATFPAGGAVYQILTGGFTTQTAGAGTLKITSVGPPISWTAEPVLKLPTRNVPLFVGSPSVKVGTITIDARSNISVTITTGNAPVTTALGNAATSLNVSTGALGTQQTPFAFTTNLVIGTATYVSMTGNFLSNVLGSGTLAPQGGGTAVAWEIQPVMSFPTPTMSLQVNGSTIGQIKIVGDKFLQFSPGGSSPSWGSPQRLQLDPKSGILSATTITLPIPVIISGAFMSDTSGSGGISIVTSITNQEDTWSADDPGDPIDPK